MVQLETELAAMTAENTQLKDKLAVFIDARNDRVCISDVAGKYRRERKEMESARDRLAARCKELEERNEIIGELVGERDQARAEVFKLSRPCDTCGGRFPNLDPEAECPRCFQEMQRQLAEQHAELLSTGLQEIAERGGKSGWGTMGSGCADYARLILAKAAEIKP